MKYRVLSANFVKPKGELVAPEDLQGLNVPALIEAGHLAEEPDPPAKDKEPKPNG
jgi:hypothetical protein